MSFCVCVRERVIGVIRWMKIEKGGGRERYYNELELN
jgi:hypothetical protein